MPLRLLLLEPEQELLESFESCFNGLTDIDVRYASDVEGCIELLESFHPDVLVLEPALPRGAGEAILQAIGQTTEGPVAAVLVLTNRRNWIDENHPSIHEYYVKPQSLRMIADRVRKLAAES
ncbi:MAG: response regulator transcription factor [Planctomycetaceae bacterium]|nr:response regulator transcription factor [Planctomycetaceae bacterium]